VVKSIAIYIEGGGPTGATRDPLRRGISAFLNPVLAEVWKRRIQWRLIVCGGRQEAYDKFCDALLKEPQVFNVLLVDSEDPVAITVAPWTHLLNRPGDGWLQPAGAEDAQCQLMVACMEAWFLADPAGVKKHFGGNCNSGKLPAANIAETRTKPDIYNALRQATRSTPAQEYRKIRDGARLLEKVDPAEVRKHCKWCERLFQTLGDAIGTSV
jgi:hypothetical protein